VYFVGNSYTLTDTKFRNELLFSAISSYCCWNPKLENRPLAIVYCLSCNSLLSWISASHFIHQQPEGIHSTWKWPN